MEKKHRKRSRERSPEGKKIKGRGVKHEPGLRSWSNALNGKINNQKKEKEKEIEKEKEKEKEIKDSADWINSELKQLENTPSKHSSKNLHNRSPESEESDLSIVRESPSYKPEAYD